MANKQQVEKIFQKTFKGGPMRRMPKSNKDAEVFLALAASIFLPRATYTEAEINEELKEWMAGFTSPTVFDHVTVRRYLVDYFFLLRDASGSSYKTNQTVINNAIEPEARSVQPREILEAAQRERELRKIVSAG